MQTKALVVSIILITNITLVFSKLRKNESSLFSKIEDTVSCCNHERLYLNLLQRHCFKEAHNYWIKIYDACPDYSQKSYLKGCTVVKELIVREKDSLKQAKLIDELMSLYDNQIAYTGARSKDEASHILSKKAIDYITYQRCDRLKKTAYQWLRQSVDSLKAKSAIPAFHYLIALSCQIYKCDSTHKALYTKDFYDVSKYMAQLDKQKGRQNDPFFKIVKQSIETNFAQSGAADCNTIQRFYKSILEENKRDLSWLESAIENFTKHHCQDNEVYKRVVRYAQKIKMSSTTSYAKMAFVVDK